MRGKGGTGMTNWEDIRRGEAIGTGTGKGYRGEDVRNRPGGRVMTTSNVAVLVNHNPYHPSSS